MSNHISNTAENAVPIDTSNPIEADLAQDDDGYETSGTQGTDTTSLCASLNEYLLENGRRYHVYYGPDKHLQPTDEPEQERLDIYHEIFYLIMGRKLYQAPIGPEVHRTLDLGTGTGIWAVEFAEEHPECEVTGVDLSPIQPNWVPPNCRFEVDDFELEWTYKPDLFDFIHGRTIVWSLKKIDAVFEEVYRHLKPGGWFEVSDFGAEFRCDDGTMPDDWPGKVAVDLNRAAYPKLGRTLVTPDMLQQHLEKAGFVNITTKTFKMPMTPWPKNPDFKQAGMLAATSADAAFQSYGLALYSRAHGMTTEEAHDLTRRAAAACMEKKTTVHCYVPLFLAYGRKPDA